MLCLTSSKAYCQRLLIDGEVADTTICFTIPQGKFLLKQYYQREECNKLLHICTMESESLLQVIDLKDSVIDRQFKMVADLEYNLSIKKTENHKLNTDLRLSRSETEKQRILKFAYLLGGSVFGGVMGVFLLR